MTNRRNPRPFTLKSISRTWICFSALLLLAPLTAQAASSEATLRAGLGYNSNPDGLADSVSGQWLARAYVSCGAHLFRLGRTTGSLHYQGGIERGLWGGSDTDSLEATATNGLALHLGHHVPGWARMGFDARVKNRSTHRLRASPGYFSQEAALSLTTRPVGRTHGVLYFRQSARDYEARFAGYAAGAYGLGVETLLPGVVSLCLTVGETRLRFDRHALCKDASGQVAADSLGGDQRDALSEVKLGLRLYTPLLLTADYAYQDNASNSYGYPYRAHKLTLIVTKDLPHGTVGQLYGSFQWRRYRDPVVGPSTEDLQVDEYEHTMCTARLSRALSKAVELDAQYAYRKASNQRERFYKQHLVSLSLSLAH